MRPEKHLNTKRLCTFVVQYKSKSGEPLHKEGADFLSPTFDRKGYSTPSWMLNGTTALGECIAEGKAIPFVFYSHQPL